MDAPIVLVQPPVCDPYAPLLGVPALSAVLKKAGATCICLDLNLELHLAAATPRGVELLRRDAEAEQTRLQDAFGPDALGPGHVRSSLGRSLLERPDLADELAAAQDALRRPELYRFGNDGKLKLTEQVGVYHGLAGLLAIPPAPFSAKRALDLADGREPLPYRSWLIEEAVPRIVSQEPAWVGISVTFEQQLLPALTLAVLLRRQGLRVFLGGFHPSTVGVEGLKADPELFDTVDGVVVGEGERAIVALYRALRDGDDLSTVAGLVWRDANHSVQGTCVAPRPSMAELPLPDLTSLPLDRYLSPVTIIPYQVSRGCYFGRCTFCNFTAVSPGYRHRPIAMVIEDLKVLSQYSRSINFTMEAELPKVCGELADALVESGLELQWEIMCRLDRGFHRPILEKMAASGCTTIFFGLESASGRINGLMDKAISGPIARRIIGDCAELGINLVLSGIRGFPGETPQEGAQTAGFYRWVQKAHGDQILISGGAHHFRLTRASPIWNDPAAFGIDTIDLGAAGPLAVNAPFRMKGKGPRSDEDNGPPGYHSGPLTGVEAGVGEQVRQGEEQAPRKRYPELMPVEDLERLGPGPQGPRRGGPPRAMQPFQHDLIRLSLEACNPGGFRHQALANRAARAKGEGGRPARFRLDPGAVVAPLARDPMRGGPADLLVCQQPAYDVEGIVLPGWFANVLAGCRGDGISLDALEAATDEHRPKPGPPAGAWLGRFVPRLWTAGVLAPGAPMETGT